MIDESLLKAPGVPQPNDETIPNPTPLTFGVHYLFQKAGVALAEHAHTDGNDHYSIIVSGSFDLTVAGMVRVVAAGDIIDLGLEPHSFVATADNSAVVNVRKVNISDESIAALKAKANATIDAISARLIGLRF